MKNVKKAVAAAAMILCVLLFLQMNTFTLSSYVAEEGYAIPKTNLKKTLEDQRLWQSEDVKLISVGLKEGIYKSSSGYHVGKDRKKSVDLSFPLIVRGGKALRFIEEGSYLIRDDFEVLPAYADLILSGGYSFHTDDEKSEPDQMLLVRTADGLYMNAQKLTIRTYLKTYAIPVNSIMNLQKEYINAYIRQQDHMKFTPVRGLQDATITVGDIRMPYSEFLKKLQGSEDAVRQQEEEKEKKKEEIRKAAKEAKEERAEESTEKLIQSETAEGAAKMENGKSTKKKKKAEESDKEGAGQQEGGAGSEMPTQTAPDEEQTPPIEQTPDSMEQPAKPQGPDKEETPGPVGPENDQPDHEDTEEEEGDGEGSGNETDEGESDDPQDMQYVRPQVSCGELKSWVYTVHADLKINDPAKRIIRGVRFNIYKDDGTLLMRKQYREDAEAELSVLPPDTDLIVEGVYQYYDEQGSKKEAAFLKPTAIRTLPIEGNVAPVQVSYAQDSYLYADYVRYERLKLKTASDIKGYEDTLNYVSRASLIFKDEEGREQTGDISMDQLKRLIKEEEISTASARNLTSATTYTWEFRIQDRFGNRLPTEPIDVQGTARTSKRIPQAKLKVEENKAGSFQIDVKLEDADEALTSTGMRLQIQDMEGQTLDLQYEIAGQGKGTDRTVMLQEKEQIIRITNLPFAQQLKVVIAADYDIEDNHGPQCDKTIGSSTFYSASLVSGVLNYTTGFTDILGTSAVIDIELNQKSTTALAELMSEFSYTLQASGYEDITYTVTKELFNKASMKDYDEDRKVLVIQREDRERKLPEITLEAGKKAFAEEGATPWQVFINGALHGTGNELAGRVHIKLAENTLIPSTAYMLTMKSTADQGGYRYDLQNMISRSSFTTRKREPQLSYTDYFMAQDFMEFYDLKVNDIDRTIIEGDYAIQLVEVNGLEEDVRQSIAMKTEETKDVLRIKGLKKDKDYRLRFVAAQYNDGASVGSMVSNHTFYEYSFKGQSGITARIDLNDMDYNYSDKSLNEGNLDISKVELNKTFQGSKVVDREGWFVTDYIPIDSEKKFLIRGFSNDKCSLLYSNANKVDVAVASADGSNYVIKAAANHAYVRISGDMEYLKKANFTEITNKQVNLPHNTIKNTVINGSDGNENYSNTGVATNFIPTVPGTILHVERSSAQNGGWYSLTMCYYDKDKKKIGKVLSGTEFTEVIPSQAAYVRISYTNITEDITEFPLYVIKGTQDTDTFQAAVNWSLQDEQQLLKQEDTYRITRYVSDDLDTISYRTDKEDTYSLRFSDEKLLKEQKTRRDLLSGEKQYRYDISIQYHNRIIVLDTVEFNTASRLHILKNSGDIALISKYPTENFIAVNNISETSNYNFFNTLSFSGTIDFQGHTLYLKGGSAFGGCSFILTNKGIIRNIIIEKDFTENKKLLINQSFGLIENVIYRPVSKGDSVINYAFIENNSNDGILRNFIVELDGEVVISAVNNTTKAILVGSNTGKIENGYMYNKVKNAHVYANGLTEPMVNGSTLIMSNSAAGHIMDVYALSDIYTILKNDGETSEYTGVIVGNQQGRINHSFSVGDRYSYTIDNGRALPGDLLPDEEPGFGRNSTSIDSVYNDTYHISENTTYKEKFSKRVSIDVLKDSKWYQKIFSNTNNFFVDEYVKLGYYPRLALSDEIMHEQPFLKLPQTAPAIKPELVNADIIKQTEDYADVIFRFKNDDYALIQDIIVEDLDCLLFEQQGKGGFYEVKARISNPKKYVSSYRVSDIVYQSNGITLSATSSYMLPVEFYDSISSFSDWQRMANNPSQNYRLKTDLDFSKVSNWKSVYVNTLTGKLDGGIYDSDGNLTGMHTLRNIVHAEDWRNYGLLINGITRGEVKNLKIDTVKTSRKDRIPMGVFGTLTYAEVNNVHIRNLELMGTDTIGGFAGASSYSTISNSSIKNMGIKINKDNTNVYYFGGFVGRASKTIIKNSFVSGLLIDTTNSLNAPTGRIGGIYGDGASTSSITNVYAEGKIMGQSNVGGLVSSESTTNIQNCWAKVKIEANDQPVGGIAATSANYVKNSLSVGDLMITRGDYTNVHRISGSNMPRGYRNYAYDNQLINGKRLGVDDAEGLLTSEDLSKTETYIDKIRMGNAFDYTNVHNGSLPLLKSTDGVLLPDQETVYLQSADLKMEILSAKKEGNDYKVDVKVTHSGFHVDTFQIDGMSVIDTREYKTDNTSTTYTLTLGIEKAVDSYILKANLKALNQSNRHEEISTIVEFDEPVYWEIHNVNQWQEIMKHHGYSSENFKIMGTIDFTGVSNPYLGIIANRFVGVDSKTSVIENLTFTYEANTKGVLANVQELGNIAFNNIDLTMVASLQNFQGIISTLNGSGKNLSFSSNNIRLLNKVSTVGTIGQCTGNLENVKISDTEILDAGNHEGSQIGGLVANMGGHLRNIEADNMKIDCPDMSNVGGLVGFHSMTSKLAVSNKDIHLSNINVRGKKNVGGMCAHGNYKTYFSVSADNINVEGKDFIGGLSGTYLTIDNRSMEKLRMHNIKVKGENFVGGVSGTGGGYELHLNNVKVEASSKYAGGLFGSSYGTPGKLAVESADVKAMYAAGGITGLGQSGEGVVLNSNIYAKKYAGGAVGSVSYIEDNGDTANSYVSSYIHNSGVIHTTVYAEDTHAGGLLGFDKFPYCLYGYVINSDIGSGNGYVGGIVGEAGGSSYASDWKASYVRNSKIHSQGDYVGGYAGYANFKYPQAAGAQTFHTTPFYVNAEITGNHHVGGLFGSVYKADNIDKSTISSFRGIVVLNSRIQALSGKAEIFSENYQDVFDMSKGTGFKVTDNTVLNGKPVTPSDIHDNGTRTWEEIIKEEDLIDPGLLNNPINNASRPGLNYGSTLYPFTHTSTTMKFYPIIVSVLPRDVPSLELHCGNLNGTYKVNISVSSISQKFENDVVFENGRAIIELPFVKGVGLRTYYIKVSKNSEMLVNTNFALDFSKTYIPLIEGETFYDDENAIPTITLPEGEYAWYRNSTYEGSYNSGKDRLQTNSNSITITSRGYYYAQNLDTGAYTPIITVNNIGYMPFIASNDIHILPYQAGFTDPDNPSFENAVDISDRLYTGGYKLPHVPYQFSDAVMRKSGHTDTLSLKKGKRQPLPGLEVYASGADSVNVELSDYVNNQKLSLIVDQNGEAHTYPVTDRVLTLGFDYMQDLSFTLSDGVQQTTYTVKAEKLRNTVSAYASHYAYTSGDAWYIDTVKQNGTCVHLYDDEALLDNGHILQDGKDSGTVSHGKLLATRSLFTSMYDGESLVSYKRFTRINEQERAFRMLVRRDYLYALDPSLNMKKENVIADSYQEERYLSVLSEDGHLLNLMQPLHLPKDFKNEDIQEISCGNDDAVMLVRYENGGLEAFNYLNGERLPVMQEQQAASMSFTAYLRKSVIRMFSAPVIGYDKVYEDAEQLQKELQGLDEQDQELLEKAEDIVLKENEAIAEKRDADKKENMDTAPEDKESKAEEQKENKESDEEAKSEYQEPAGKDYREAASVTKDTEDTQKQSENTEANATESTGRKNSKAKKKTGKQDTGLVKQPYVAVFKPQEERYVLYRREDLLDDTQKRTVSENEKLNALQEQGKALDVKAAARHSEATRAENRIPVLLGFMLILSAITVLLAVLYRRRRHAG